MPRNEDARWARLVRSLFGYLDGSRCARCGERIEIEEYGSTARVIDLLAGTVHPLQIDPPDLSHLKMEAEKYPFFSSDCASILYAGARHYISKDHRPPAPVYIWDPEQAPETIKAMFTKSGRLVVVFRAWMVEALVKGGLLVDNPIEGYEMNGYTVVLI